MNRRVKILCLATYLAMGTYLTQLGGCFSIAANTALAAFPLPNFLPDSGVLAFCGTPNIQLVDQNGVPTGVILNGEDDLVFFCPATPVMTGGGGGG